MTGEPIILLAEDSEDDVILIERAFRKARLMVPLKVVHDGQEAICYLSGFAHFGDRTQFPLPDIFLLDLKLPIRDGFEVLRWMKTQPELKKLLNTQHYAAAADVVMLRNGFITLAR